MVNTITYADGFGRWHALVPRRDATALAAARHARGAIRRELRARDASGPGHIVHVDLLGTTPQHYHYAER